MLFGRESELARLEALLAQTAGGGVLVLRGDIGVGKSALLAHAVGLASSMNMRVLSVVGVQAEMDLPFAGLSQLLRPLLRADHVPRAGQDQLQHLDGLSNSTSPVQVALAALELLTINAALRPVLVVVDDGQWLDHASWEALAFIARRVEFDNVRLLLALRDGEESDARLSAGLLPELRIEPLAELVAAAMLNEVANLAEPLRLRILAQAAGNPLGILELAQVAHSVGEEALLPGWLPLSERLERAFGRVLTELGAACRALLLVAALDDEGELQRILRATTLLHGGSVNLEDVQPAIAARLIEVDGTSLRFRHPLVRSAVRQAASVSQRQQAHRALAEVLSSGDDRSVWHRAAAAIGPDEVVARGLVAISERARRRGAVVTAMDAMERAAQLSEDPALRASRLLRAAELGTDQGDLKAVVRLIRSIEYRELRVTERTRVDWLREGYLNGGWSGADRLLNSVAIAERMRLAGDTELALDSLVLMSMRAWWANPTQSTRDQILAVTERLDVAPTDPRMVSTLALVAPVERGATVMDRLSENDKPVWPHCAGSIWPHPLDVDVAWGLAV